jgi:hypothetical protein
MSLVLSGLRDKKSGQEKALLPFQESRALMGKAWLIVPCSSSLPLLANLRAGFAPLKVFQNLDHGHSSKSSTQRNPMTL